MINNIDSLKISYPWLWEDNLDMIVHNDFDGLLSAYLLHNFKNWNIIGFYDLKNIWYSKQKDIDDLRNAIWVDLDISRPHIRSIGHHILKLNDDQPAPYLKQSFNPNLMRNITRLNFRTKYPLGTCHLIIALNDIVIENNGLSKHLFWHPDSSWINGQKHKYFKNVNCWIDSFLQIPLLLDTINEINGIEFETDILNSFYSEIEKCGFQQGYSYIKSLNLKIKGYQCTFNNPIVEKDKITRLFGLMNSILGWNIPNLPNEYVKITGKREKIEINQLISNYGDMDNFIKIEDVFSYSIPFQNSINFTNGFEL